MASNRTSPYATSIAFACCMLVAAILTHFITVSKGKQQFFSPEVCCGDVPLKMDEHSQCCGNHSYSSAESMCCWEARHGHYVLPLPASVLQPSSAKHQSNVSESLQVHQLHMDAARFLTCCHDRLYDFRFYTCCDGVVRKQSLTGNTGCCSRHIYDPYSQLCCQGHILPKTTFSSYCCGDKSYDNTKEVCCGDLVFPGHKPHPVPTPTTSSAATATATTTTTTLVAATSLSCCGNGTYDTDSELCCSGGVRLVKHKATSYCCGSDQFDWDTEICCNGLVHSKTSDTELCCARQIYDSSTHMCCTDKVVAKKKRKALNIDSGRSAVSVDVSQHLRLSRRRFDILTTKDDESELCCGNNATYDFDTEICCDGRVYERDADRQTSDDIKCCGKTLYRDDRQICCEGTVLAKATRAEDCCGRRVFNVQSQVCCQGVIHDLLESDSLLYCCGNSTFHPLKETCCNGRKTAKAAILSNEA